MLTSATLDDGSAVTRDWDFVATRASPRIVAIRCRNALLRRVPPPASELLRPPFPAPRWTVYFAFMPDGALSDAHRFTLARLRALGRPLLVICAAQSVDLIPAELAAAADALVWKALPGFDFSAYRVGLAALAEHAPGCDAFVMNDSVFGPLGDVGPALDAARWDLTGFIATATVENHVQSYAFQLRGVTRDRLAALAAVMPDQYAYDGFWDVVLNQETRFARVAARRLRVGALVHVDLPGQTLDPTLQCALPLVRAGFPFLKRSLLGKLAGLWPREEVVAVLRAAGHPL